MPNLQFPIKYLEIPSTSHRYAYIHISPTTAQRATIAFFHGFPSTSFGWRYQIEYFSSLGYGVLAPDLLGYGGTSKPTSSAEYTMSSMVHAIATILDHEQIDTFHGVSHDFGSHLMSRLYNYHSSRFRSLTFIAVPYNAPGSHFDLDFINKMTLERIGMQKFGYMKFLSSDQAPDIIERNLKSFQSLVYDADADFKAEHFYPPGKLQEWLESGQVRPQVITNEQDTATWLDTFAKGGFRGPTNWYRMLVGNLNEAEEKKALDSGLLTTKITQPVLALDGKPDKASFPGFMEMSIKPYAEHLDTRAVSAQGHWYHLVAHEEVNDLIGQFLEKSEQ